MYRLRLDNKTMVHTVCLDIRSGSELSIDHRNFLLSTYNVPQLSNQRYVMNRTKDEHVSNAGSDKGLVRTRGPLY